MPNEKLEKLKHDQYVAEKKLTAAQHREKRLKNELKRLTRSERTHRLCTRAGMLEDSLNSGDMRNQDFGQEGYSPLRHKCLSPVYFVYAVIGSISNVQYQRLEREKSVFEKVMKGE